MDFQKLRADYLLDNFLSSLHLEKDLIVSQYSSFIPLVLFLLGLTAIVFILRKFLTIRKSLNETSILLELTPPAFMQKTAYTTQQLFSVIHNLGDRRTFWEKLLGKKIVFSFEIASTLNQGIRYLIRTTPDEVNNVKRSLISYLPQVNVKIANEYLPPQSKVLKSYYSKVVEFKLKKHFAYPLQKQEILKEHDPVAYITGMMTKLSPGELISFQIVLSPIQTGKTDHIQRKILNNEDALGHLNGTPFPWPIKFISSLLMLLMKIITSLMGFVAWGITDLVNSGRTSSYQTQVPRVKPVRILSSFEQETVKSVQEKIDQPLFETSIRLLVLVKDKYEQRERIKGFISSLAVFSVPKYQSFKLKFNFLPYIIDRIRLLAFRKRLLSLLFDNSSSWLSVSEVSDLYHFPFQNVTQTENIVKIHSKELPAPLSLKNNSKLDMIFAKNTYGGTTTDIGLTKEEREKHVYMIGATGAGKTTMILSMADKDINDGKGVCVIDPHGDLAKTLIATVPEKRKKDFIYINPDDIKYPIGINLLELTPNLDEDDLLREKELITESVVSLFRKIFSEVWSAHAHRLEYILRNTIQTALTMKNPTIFTVYELLTDPTVQENIIITLEDENLKNFWKYEFGLAGDYQKVKMIGSVTSRIGRFLFSPFAKRMLEQTKSTINFDDILDSGKILICNLAKGSIGEDNTEVMGIMILAKLQLAALKRARISQQKRTPFYLYVDEFQTFATPSFVQMLSEARKYRIFLTIAEQSTSQQKDRNLVNVILANVGTVISFKSANPDDEKLMLLQFEPYVDKGEIANLPKYRFYMKVSADKPEEPFSGETILTDIKEGKKNIESLLQSSRDNWAIKYIKPNTVKKAEGNKSDGKDNGQKEEFSKPSDYLTIG